MSVSDGANHLEASAKLATGPVNFNVGYYSVDDGEQRFGGTVAGNLAAINWEVGYDAGTDSCGDACDDQRFGFHVGYGIGDGNVYAQYSDKDTDADDMGNEKDTSGWVFGYSHVLAANVVAYAEYSMTDAMMDGGEMETAQAVAAIKVGF